MNRTDLVNNLKEVIIQLEQGCSDINCKIAKNTIGTNGSCYCLPRHFARTLLSLSDNIKNSYKHYEDWKKS